MTKRRKYGVKALQHSFNTHLDPAEPLWKRVPTYDDKGQRLSDFMMIIPRLAHRPHHYLKRTLNNIQEVLDGYEQVVVFADLNLKLNVLWVSVRPRPGICLELPTAIKARVPEAVLVAQNVNSVPGR